MTIVDALTPRDRQLAADGLDDFLPKEIYDIHTHPYNAAHFPAGEWPFLGNKQVLGCADHRSALQRYMAVPTIQHLS